MVNDAIKSGKVKMIPKWHFVLKTIFVVLIGLILFSVIIYFLTFVGLVMHERYLLEILDLGPRGTMHFMRTIPWVIILLVTLLLITFYILVKNYSFIDKKPAVYSFFGVIFLALFVGFLIHIFDVDFKLAKIGERPNVPVLGPMHKHYRGEFKNRPRFDPKDKRMMPPPKLNFEIK